MTASRRAAEVHGGSRTVVGADRQAAVVHRGRNGIFAACKLNVIVVHFVQLTAPEGIHLTAVYRFAHKGHIHIPGVAFRHNDGEGTLHDRVIGKLHAKAHVGGAHLQAPDGMRAVAPGDNGFVIHLVTHMPAKAAGSLVQHSPVKGDAFTHLQIERSRGNTQFGNSQLSRIIHLHRAGSLIGGGTVLQFQTHGHIHGAAMSAAGRTVQMQGRCFAVGGRNGHACVVGHGQVVIFTEKLHTVVIHIVQLTAVIPFAVNRRTVHHFVHKGHVHIPGIDFDFLFTQNDHIVAVDQLIDQTGGAFIVAGQHLVVPVIGCNGAVHHFGIKIPGRVIVAVGELRHAKLLAFAGKQLDILQIHARYFRHGQRVLVDQGDGALRGIGIIGIILMGNGNVYSQRRSLCLIRILQEHDHIAVSCIVSHFGAYSRLAGGSGGGDLVHIHSLAIVLNAMEVDLGKFQTVAEHLGIRDVGITEGPVALRRRRAHDHPLGTDVAVVVPVVDVVSQFGFAHALAGQDVGFVGSNAVTAAQIAVMAPVCVVRQIHMAGFVGGAKRQVDNVSRRRHSRERLQNADIMQRGGMRFGMGIVGIRFMGKGDGDRQAAALGITTQEHDQPIVVVLIPIHRYSRLVRGHRNGVFARIDSLTLILDAGNFHRIGIDLLTMLGIRADDLIGHHIDAAESPVILGFAAFAAAFINAGTDLNRLGTDFLLVVPVFQHVYQLGGAVGNTGNGVGFTVPFGCRLIVHEPEEIPVFSRTAQRHRRDLVATGQRHTNFFSRHRHRRHIQIRHLHKADGIHFFMINVGIAQQHNLHIYIYCFSTIIRRTSQVELIAILADAKPGIAGNAHFICAGIQQLAIVSHRVHHPGDAVVFADPFTVHADCGTGNIHIPQILLIIAFVAAFINAGTDHHFLSADDHAVVPHLNLMLQRGGAVAHTGHRVGFPLPGSDIAIGNIHMGFPAKFLIFLGQLGALDHLTFVHCQFDLVLREGGRRYINIRSRDHLDGVIDRVFIFFAVNLRTNGHIHVHDVLLRFADDHDGRMVAVVRRQFHSRIVAKAQFILIAAQFGHFSAVVKEHTVQLTGIVHISGNCGAEHHGIHPADVCRQGALRFVRLVAAFVAAFINAGADHNGPLANRYLIVAIIQSVHQRGGAVVHGAQLLFVH